MSYTLQETGPDAFAQRWSDFARAGGAGANITLPLKALAYQCCDEWGPEALQSGVVNTLTRIGDRRWRGDNTDGRGLLSDLTQRWRAVISGCRALVLGAGGAVQGTLPALLSAGVARIDLVNRSAAAALAIEERYRGSGRLFAHSWDTLARLGGFDLLVNGTAMGHQVAHWDLPASLLAPNALAYDMNYGQAARAFTAWARAAGCARVHDGLGMLVEQAAASFALWHGVVPDTQAVYLALRAADAQLPA